MKRTIVIGTFLLALSACGSDETAEPTVTTAEVTTTEAPTTTVALTTVPPTTVTTVMDEAAQDAQNSFLLSMVMNANMTDHPEVVLPVCDMHKQVAPDTFFVLIRGGLATEDNLADFPGWTADDLAHAYIEEFERVCP